ncbi:nucleotide modification associated domain-containing protein [Parasutterella muris]|uniref:nucleotide modification associated domain-containing protein n=1 Tax=Parasutterella muris TaxID=2565572 RepID=UPI001924E2D1|nr:nucleotide modification associated domain-containing protein [Parasutterella muris]
MTEINKYKIHKEICSALHQTYVAKNSDYGDSFSKTRLEFPESILVRLSDKFERIKSLYKKTDRQVKDESIEDTLLDLANYAMMEVVERRAEKLGRSLDMGARADSGNFAPSWPYEMKDEDCDVNHVSLPSCKCFKTK